MIKQYMGVSLILIESELQLRSFVHFTKQYSDFNKYHLIIRYNGVKKNDQRIDLCLKENADIFEHVYTFKAIKSRKLDFFIFLIKFSLTIFNSKTYDSIYVGDYRSKWMKFIYKLNSNTIIFLDDGAATINFYNAINKGIIKIDRPFSLLTSLGIESTDKVDVIAIKNTLIQKNKINNKIIFIGMGLVEAGYMDEYDYILALEFVFNQFKGFEIEYIPHRIESINKLDLLMKNYPLKINEIDVSIEEYLLSLDECPEKLCSFYSTALINLANTISGPEIVSFNFNKSKLRVDIQDQVSDVYAFFSAHKYITMIESFE